MESPSAMTDGHLPSQAMTRQHGSSPSFPQLVSETPITPSLVPSEAFERQNSHSLFSPHDLTPILPAEPAQSCHGELTQTLTHGLSQAGIAMSSIAATPITNGYRQTDAHHMNHSQQEELSMRSRSLGKLKNPAACDGRRNYNIVGHQAASLGHSPRIEASSQACYTTVSTKCFP